MLFDAFCRLERVHAAETDAFLTLSVPSGLIVLFLEKGRCTLACEGYNAVAAGGSLIACAATLEIQPMETCSFLYAYLEGEAAEALNKELIEPLVVKQNAAAGADMLLNELLEGNGRLSPVETAELCYSLCCRVFAAMQKADAMPPLVEAALGEIHAHFAELYGVEELAASLAVSKGHLSRSFTQALGVSPGRYLILVRLSHAKRLLLYPEYPLEIVAGLCGFSGANYFCKVFKKETGETPDAWRKRAGAAALPREEQAAYL